MHRGTDQPRVLLICDAYRNWGFPKGHVESGETLESAAQREVTEETGLRQLVVRAPLNPIAWQFQFRGDRVHKTCHFFLMETSDPATTPQHDEGISACQWMTFSEAEAMVAYDNARGVLRQARTLALG